MEECPLARELLKDPMRAREFVENHARLPLWTRAFLWLVRGLLG